MDAVTEKPQRTGSRFSSIFGRFFGMGPSPVDRSKEFQKGAESELQIKKEELDNNPKKLETP